MIIIDENLCKGCRLCLYMCPQNVYAISSEPNKKAYNCRMLILEIGVTNVVNVK